MHARFRLYRSVGYGYASSALYALPRMPLVAALVLSAACHAPTAPTPTPVQPVHVVVDAVPTPMPAQEPVLPIAQEVLHHNIPFSVVGQEGEVLWLCSTQPRTYTTAAGATITERDHYAQEQPCPAVPVP